MKTIQEFIDTIHTRRHKNDLPVLNECLEKIGNPHKQIRTIHVGGTNGKGSTCNYIQDILRSKYTVGFFSSPHLLVHNERIRLNGVPISDETLLEYGLRYWDLFEEYELSMFEIDVIIALKYFADMQVDFAVFEVGLGGAYDATNVLHPLVSVITNISYDHQQILGPTIQEITQAKSGIIKRNTHCITSEDKLVCETMLKNVCSYKNTTYQKVYDVPTTIVDNRLEFTYKQFSISLPTIARYQSINCIMALETIVYLREHNYIAIDDATIVSSLANSFWIGRLQKIHTNPTVYIDGAHNVHGIRALCESLQDIGNVRILFSAMANKEIDRMLDILLIDNKDITVTTFSTENSATLSQLSHHRQVKKMSIERFFQENKDSTIPIVVCGSLYFVAEVVRKMNKGQLL